MPQLAQTHDQRFCIKRGILRRDHCLGETLRNTENSIHTLFGPATSILISEVAWGSCATMLELPEIQGWPHFRGLDCHY